MDLNAADIASVIMNTIMLLVGGIFDKKFRQLPIAYLLVYGVTAAAFMVYRLSVAPDDVRMAIAVSSVLSIGMVSGLAVLSYTTRMVGTGDILIIVLSFMMTPYAPGVCGMAPLPLLIPLSVIAGTLMIYLRYLRETKVVEALPRRFRRVVVKTAGELRRMKALTYYPVYISGKGYVYEKVFKSDDPVQESLKVLSNLQDDDVVFAVPSYPFVYYYAAGFILVSVILLLLLLYGLVFSLPVS